MPRRRKESLPAYVRRHGLGYRAVITSRRTGERARSTTMHTVREVEEWIQIFKLAETLPIEKLTLTLAGGLRLIELDLEATDARQATFDYYRDTARTLFRELGGDHQHVDAVGPEQLQAYISKRKAAGVSPATIVRKELFVLRRLLKLARAGGYLVRPDPFVGIRMPKVRTTRFEVLTRDRIAELVGKMRASTQREAAWHADLVELLFCTGLRRAELERLRVADIDFAAGRLFVDGKTDARYQPIGEGLEPALRRLIADALPDGRLIVSHRTLEKLFERWKKRLGEPRFSAHVLRHSYATALAHHVSPWELMALMGHSSLEQTARYYHGRGTLVRSALAALELRSPVGGLLAQSAVPAPDREARGS